MSINEIAANNINAQFSSEEVDWKTYEKRWDAIWVDGVAPGARWDKGEASPALVEFLKNNQKEVEGKRAVVPGCGRGYDVVAFAKAGVSKALGLDLSPVAVKEANAYVSQALSSQGLQGKALVAEDNFFTFDDPEGLFDFGYDYTFFCALHPSMRDQWASSWARALRPGGKLLTLQYPVDPSLDPERGPPFPVTPQLYRKHLEAAGFVCEAEEQVAAPLSGPHRAGKEFFGVYRRL